MVLLCLDYLRDLRRAYPDKNDLLDAEGYTARDVCLQERARFRQPLSPACRACAQLFQPNAPLPSLAELQASYKRTLTRRRRERKAQHRRQQESQALGKAAATTTPRPQG